MSVPNKAAPRLQYGIFLGYRMAPGGRWTGEYLIADLDDFVGKSLRWDAPATNWPRHTPHITKHIMLGDKGVEYPLKERYDWFNYTVEGREAALPKTDDAEDLPPARHLEIQFPKKDPSPPPPEEDDGLVPYGTYGFSYDKQNRAYQLDAYGNRMRRESVYDGRPPIVPQAEWKEMDVLARKDA